MSGIGCQRAHGTPPNLVLIDRVGVNSCCYNVTLCADNSWKKWDLACTYCAGVEESAAFAECLSHFSEYCKHSLLFVCPSTPFIRRAGRWHQKLAAEVVRLFLGGERKQTRSVYLQSVV